MDREQQIEALAGACEGPYVSDRLLGLLVDGPVAAMLAEADQAGERRGRKIGWDEGRASAWGVGWEQRTNPYADAEPAEEVQCPGDCPDDCARCCSGNWALMCDDCRSYAAQDNTGVQR